jgi:hypothetical protein
LSNAMAQEHSVALAGPVSLSIVDLGRECNA